MQEYKWSLQKAFKYVKDRRPIVRPNRGFMRQLMEFDFKLNGVSSLGRLEQSSSSTNQKINTNQK